jgi:ectoine hydroxylase-related dioxygenase (phytanoyl-CoA dioxygenase family)
MHDLEGDGYALADISLGSGQCEYLASSLPSVIGAGRGGIRNLIAHPTVVALLHHPKLGSYLWSIIGRDLVAVNATLFDKPPESNWDLKWHQDRLITVKERLELAGYGPWAMKAGTLHVEPPARVLTQMIAVRVHLDEASASNGALRVIPGSHRLGKLNPFEMTRATMAGPQVELSVPQGGLLLMRPLLVHAISAEAAPIHRRVLHIEFAPADVISPLYWHSAVTLRRAA